MFSKSVSKTIPSRLPKLPLKLFFWAGSFTLIMVWLYRSAYDPNRYVHNARSGPIVNLVLSEEMEFDVNEPVDMTFGSADSFIIRNVKSSEVISSIEQKDGYNFPMGWSDKTFHSLDMHEASGKWSLADGDDVRLRISGSPKLLVRLVPGSLNRDSQFLLLAILIGWLWFLIALKIFGKWV